MRRFTVPQAAETLGMTTDALRMRPSRGRLDSDKQDGWVYILLEDDQTSDTSTVSLGSARELVDAKDETNRLLTQQLESERRPKEENRRIIPALCARIPELEPPAEEPRESPLRAQEDEPTPSPGDPRPGPETGSQRPGGAGPSTSRLAYQALECREA